MFHIMQAVYKDHQLAKETVKYSSKRLKGYLKICFHD